MSRRPFVSAEKQSVSNGCNQYVTASFTSSSVVDRLSARWCHLRTDIWHLFLLCWDGATVGLKSHWWQCGGLICIHWNQNKVLGIRVFIIELFEIVIVLQNYMAVQDVKTNLSLYCCLIFCHCVFLRFSLASVKHGKLCSVSSDCNWCKAISIHLMKNKFLWLELHLSAAHLLHV